MNMIWVCISSVLSIASVISGQNIDTSHIRVFPARNQTIAGVFQVTFVNRRNQPEYAFNASEARGLCESLGVDIASKAQVQDALSRGLETCRFGWIDEHFVVIPRIKALSNCGQSQIGLVKWRASVTKKFDVFCFNETDAATQLKDTTSDIPLSGRDFSGETNSTQTTHSTPSSSSSPSPSFTSAPNILDNEIKPARYVSGTQGSAGAKAVVITSTCALLLIAIIIFTYLKLRRHSQSSDTKQEQEDIETEDWMSVKNIKETEEDAQEDERIEMDDNAS